MKKTITTVYLICAGIFIVGIILGLLGRLICVRNNDNYEVLQEEFKGPDVIAEVFQHDVSKKIYVCYNDASYVNVYSSDGEFLWAVSTPYLRNCDFILTKDTLIISGKDSYIYNCHNGEFIKKINTNDFNMENSDENDELIPGDLVYDTYNVYEYLGNNAYKKIVERPWWHWIFNFPIDWLISFGAVLVAGILFLIEKIREYEKETKHQIVSDKKVKFIINYYKISSSIQMLYSIVGLLLGFIYKEVIIGLIPICVHFIISNIILFNIQDSINNNHNVKIDGKEKMSFWKYINIATIIIAFIISVTFLLF